MKVYQIIVLASALVGCSQRVADEVLVEVNGEPITASYVRDVVLINAKMAEMSGRGVPKENLTAWGNDFARAILPGLVTAALWERKIRQSGEKAEACDIAQVLANYNRNTGKNAATADELAGFFGELKTQFRDQFERSALFTAYARRHPQAEVTAQDVARYYQAQSNLLETAKAIDKKARLNAEKAWRELSAGAEWAKVAKTCSEDRLVEEANESFAEDWTTVGEDGFGYPELAKALPTLKPGGFSKPIETEEGLMIVRCNGMDGKKYELSRILFRMAEPVVFPKEEEVREILAQERTEEAQVELARMLHADATVYYPHGTNFKFTVFKEQAK